VRIWICETRRRLGKVSKDICKVRRVSPDVGESPLLLRHHQPSWFVHLSTHRHFSTPSSAHRRPAVGAFYPRLRYRIHHQTSHPTTSSSNREPKSVCAVPNTRLYIFEPAMVWKEPLPIVMKHDAPTLQSVRPSSYQSCSFRQ
jgi:hypothetical protein